MFVTQPTNTADGDPVKFDKLDDAIQYCLAVRSLDIRANVLDGTGEIVYQNYPQYTSTRNEWV